MMETDSFPARQAARKKSYAAFAVGLIPFNALVLFIAILVGLATLKFGFPFAILLVPVVLVAFVSTTLQFFLGLFALRESPGFGLLAVLTAPVLLGVTVLPVIGAGGLAWGRPLRIRGRQLFPELREGSDWTRGPRPDTTGLDAPTREALAALWLHDAQKEHASVPAFSRISWMLAAVGAPANLMEWAHRSALQEIEHTRLCFALAAAYGGQSYSVEPMPDLLLDRFDEKTDPIVTLAIESLSDGCLLEDFNADVAHACSLLCEEPSTRSVLETIARDERSHADFSWALLEWTFGHSPQKVRAAMEEARSRLGKAARPTAANEKNAPVLARADAQEMLRHGRLPDERIAELWELRLAATRGRLSELLVLPIAA